METISKPTKYVLGILLVGALFGFGWCAGKSKSGPADLDDIVSRIDNAKKVVDSINHVNTVSKIRAVDVISDANLMTTKKETVFMLEVIKDSFDYRMKPDSSAFVKEWYLDTTYYARFYIFDSAKKRIDTLIRQVNEDWIISVSEKDFTNKIDIKRFQ